MGPQSTSPGHSSWRGSSSPEPHLPDQLTTFPFLVCPEMAPQVPRSVVLKGRAPPPEESLCVGHRLSCVLLHSESQWEGLQGGESKPEGLRVLGWRTPPDLPDLGAKVSGVHGLLSWEALVRDSIKLLFSRFALFSAQMSLLSSRSNCYMIDSSC
jgi:hypothetical protein